MAGLARKPDKTKEMSTFEQIRGNLRVTHLQQFQEIYDPEQRRKGIRIYDFTSGEHRWWMQDEEHGDLLTYRALTPAAQLREEDEMRVLRLLHKEWLEEEFEEEDKRLTEEAEKIKTETKELSQKPESDPQLVETAEFVTKMSEEILEQKTRLTNNILKETGKRSNPQNREDGVFERLRNNNSADHSRGPKHKLRTKRAADENMEDFARQRKYHDVLKGEYHKGISLKVEKGMSADQFIQMITTCHPKFANNSASLKDVCCDVKKYIQQISRLVQEKISNLPEEVRKKLESVVTSFQRLIVGMWKLLLYKLLLYEMTSLLASYQREKKNISRKKGRLKYSFQMASMMALWLAHDVESNPGPSYDIRSGLERITRQLSEALRYHLPVEGYLWSESVAEAAYAAGYSTDCQWSNPSGNKKDKLMLLIKRATELGRVLTTLGCLPTELAPFVNDLGNYAVQEQLVIHYKVENLRSAVDSILASSSLGDEHKQAIMHEIQRLKQISGVPHSSDRPVDNGRFCNCTDFEQLADSSTLHPTVSYQKKRVRRKHNIDRPRKENGNNSEIVNTSAVPEPEDEVTFCQQMNPGSEGNNENRIVLKLDETTSTVSKVQEVTVKGDMATKSLSATRTVPDGTSASGEIPTLSVSTKGSESFGSTAYAIDSNMTINQPDNKGIDDILIWLDQNVMDDDRRNADMPRTATNSSGMTQLQVSELATISATGSIPTGQGEEVKQQKTVDNLNDQFIRVFETPKNVLGANPPVLSEVVTFPPEGDQAFQKHVDHAIEQEETEWINYASPWINDDQIMGLQNLFPGQTVLFPAEGSTNGSGVEESSININPDITESDRDSDLTLQENTGEDGTINYLERDNDNLTQDRAEAEEHRTGDDNSIAHFVQGEQIAQTESETEFLQQTISPLATVSNRGHEAVRDKQTSVDGVRRNGAEDDTCENESETVSSREEQFADAETETELIQQTVSPMTSVTNSYPDTDRDEMYREETVDDNTSVARGNEAEDLTLGTEQFASTEPADTNKQRMEPTVDEHLAKFKASFVEEFNARFDARFDARFYACLEAIMAVLGNNTRNEHVMQSENREPLDCASTDVEHTEHRVRSSDSSRKRNLTDPESGPTPKKLRQ